MKKLILIIAFLNVNLWAINTTGYVEISEVKIWSKHVDIYLSSKEKHQCTNTKYTTRFLLEGDYFNEKYISFSLSAFAANHKVMLAYGCNNEGHPYVYGIRVRK